jgi:pimeloyl-ACP methyl ester carboxylesterase
VTQARPAAAPRRSDTIEVRRHMVTNGDGWRLSLTQTRDPARLRGDRRPVLIVPGYGMNSFIFSFHPRGLSMEGYLVEAGFEVWRADLRGQGDARREGGGDDYALEDLALTDLGAVIDAVLARTQRPSTASRVDVVGASLGGTLMFIHAVANPRHKMGSLVSMGAPVRWVAIHPALRVAFGSPTIAGLVRFRGTRRLAEIAFPRIVAHAPWVLSIYMNSAITDTSAAAEMVKTVEDPNRHVNREISRWIRERDLRVHGTNVSHAIRAIQRPLLCIYANSDGIVPPATATFPYHQVSSRSKALLEVGDRDMAVAHADLFLCNEAHERVFRPLAEWLAEQSED